MIIIFFNLIYHLLIYKKHDNNIIFVTAAEKNYFNELDSLINSFYKHLTNKLYFMILVLIKTINILQR